MELPAAVLGALLATLTACGSSGDRQGSGDGIDRYLSAVKSEDGSIVGQLHSGALPSGSGPSIQAVHGGAVLPGGSSLVSLSSSSAIDRVVVGVEGASGYYELGSLPSGAAQTVILTLAQAPPPTFSFLLAGGSGSSVGASTALPVTLTQVGTGDVQVSITWDVDSDVDLHVREPSGEEIYFGNRTSASGGELDLDSNAACSLDHKRAENVTWPAGSAPSGPYVVAVALFDACGQGETHFVVTVNVKGKPPQTAASRLTGGGEQCGSLFSGFDVTCGNLILNFGSP